VLADFKNTSHRVRTCFGGARNLPERAFEANGVNPRIICGHGIIDVPAAGCGPRL
jgi:hypothetical protein